MVEFDHSLSEVGEEDDEPIEWEGPKRKWKKPPTVAVWAGLIFLFILVASC